MADKRLSVNSHPLSECLCGAIRALDQVGVLGADHSVRRATSAPSGDRIHRALSSGTQSPGPREPADRRPGGELALEQGRYGTANGSEESWTTIIARPP